MEGKNRMARNVSGKTQNWKGRSYGPDVVVAYEEVCSNSGRLIPGFEEDVPFDKYVPEGKVPEASKGPVVPKVPFARMAEALLSNRRNSAKGVK